MCLFRQQTYVADLKALVIRDSPHLQNTKIPDSIGKLKQLRYFELTFTFALQHISFNVMTEWQELRYIGLHALLAVNSYIPSQFWKLPHLNTVIIEYCNLNETIFNVNEFAGCSKSISRVALNGNNLICDGTVSINGAEYDGFGYLSQFYNSLDGTEFNTATMNNDNDVDENLIALVEFIETYDPCFAPCSGSVEAVYWSCSTANWMDGRCTDGCDIEECGFDGGDCNQLCNYDECSMELLWNDECNLECNNTECKFDFLNCVDTLETNENGTCYVGNASIDDYNSSSSSYNSTNYEFNSQVSKICYNEWTTDSWCDLNCNRDECNNDGDYCSANSCEQDDSNCHVAYQYISPIASISLPYELILMDDICDNWIVIGSIIDTTSFANCTQFFQTYDINGNNYLGFHEAIRVTAAYLNIDSYIDWQTKLEQIDCSHCMQNASLWDW